MTIYLFDGTKLACHCIEFGKGKLIAEGMRGEYRVFELNEIVRITCK